jgi:hypothetical protein
MGKIRRKSKSRNYSKRRVSQKVKRSKIRRKSKTRNSSKRRVSQKVKRKSLRKIRKQKRIKRSTQKGGTSWFDSSEEEGEEEGNENMNLLMKKLKAEKVPRAWSKAVAARAKLHSKRARMKAKVEEKKAVEREAKRGAEAAKADGTYTLAEALATNLRYGPDSHETEEERKALQVEGARRAKWMYEVGKPAPAEPAPAEPPGDDDDDDDAAFGGGRAFG